MIESDLPQINALESTEMKLSRFAASLICFPGIRPR